MALYGWFDRVTLFLMNANSQKARTPRLFSRSWQRRLTAILLSVASLSLPVTTILSCAGGGQDEDDIELLAPADPPLPELGFEGVIPAGAPSRIVSLIPSCTELLFALGLGDRVIGVDRWADFPAEVSDLPRLGDVKQIRTEAILDLKPDMVIVFDTSTDHVEHLRQRGIRVVSPPTEASQGIFEGIVTVAESVGVKRRGELLVRSIQDKVARIRERLKGRPKPRVLMVFERDPSISVGTRTSFIQEMISSAGGINVSAGAHAERHFTYVSAEQILDWAPDVVIDLTVGSGTNRDVEEARAYWRQVGIRKSRVVLLRAPAISRPGARYAESVDILAQVIHDS